MHGRDGKGQVISMEKRCCKKLETNTIICTCFFSSFQENVCVRTTKHNKVFEYER